ncbi:MAG: SOS response-associated peptidase family protein, partial [Burkholderiaceae bacterium]|nr:SOS response-associated peptidase family protein [Burkholderiaceae bacterium]
DIEAFARLYGFRCIDDRIKIPKAVEVAFHGAGSRLESSIKAELKQFQSQQTTKLEQELFKQRKRLADAERVLQAKPTKAAVESQRIATNKIGWLREKLADLSRTELKGQDSRIYPGYYAPVMIWENGRRIIKPMRYQCRPAGKPAAYDAKYPGTYNARRDNLEGFWKEQFGHAHGLMVVSAFYEHVSIPRTGAEPEKMILEFKPRPQQNMLVACLWSRWTAPGEAELLSFAAITDEPPPEVAAAGHDRCIIPIKPENIDAWLNPNPKKLASLYAILDDRERPYYEHRLAA